MLRIQGKKLKYRETQGKFREFCCRKPVGTLKYKKVDPDILGKFNTISD